MSSKNTDPDFYGLWSHRQLAVECARLNQVLIDCIEIAEQTGKILGEMKNDK